MGGGGGGDGVGGVGGGGDEVGGVEGGGPYAANKYLQSCFSSSFVVFIPSVIPGIAIIAAQIFKEVRILPDFQFSDKNNKF